MKKTALKALLIIFIMAIILSSVIACNNKNSNTNDNSLQKIIDAKKIVVGIDGEYPPMSFSDNGEHVGFDVDMAGEMCSRLGVTLEIKPIDWSKKEELLNNGTIDCIWSGFVITQARSEAMCLSEPYIKNEVIAVVTGESDVTVLTELKGKKLGLQSGSATHDALAASELNGKVEVVPFSSALTMFDKLELGEIDAAIADSLNAYYYLLSSGKKFYVLSDCLSEEECAVAFRKGDVALRDKVQKIIGEMKADGKLGEISKKWFGSDITIVR